MRLSARRLTLATLARQHLLERSSVEVAEAVRSVGALQAQEPASPYIALWNRVAGFDPDRLDAAFADGSVVKATLMRITLHAVHADDYAGFHAAMVPTLRASRLHDRRFRVSGLSIADADAALPAALRFAAKPRTRPEMEAMLAQHVGEASGQLWWAYKTFAPLHHVPSGAPWSFGPRASYRAATPVAPPAELDEARKLLARRYLAAFGPARAEDFAQFTMLTRAVAREAIAALGDEVVVLEGPDGAPLFDIAGGEVPDEDVVPPPRLLPMWDSTLLAYADRTRLIPPEYRTEVTRVNGDVLPTLLVGGRVAGVWRPVEGGIEATAFGPLSDDEWAGLSREARALTEVLAKRDATPYARYGHWWNRLSPSEVRLLAAS